MRIGYVAHNPLHIAFGGAVQLQATHGSLL
jgi:hypothetical protein